MKPIIAAFIVLFCTSLQAQVLPAADTIAAIVTVKSDSSSSKFSSVLRELRPIAGAPSPFYTHFWEFGDGCYSFEKEPVHTYPDSGSYQVRLYATNNYDDGKPPPTRPKKITVPQKPVSKLLAQNTPLFFKSGSNVELKTNRMPRPAEELVLLVGYRNKTEWNIPNLSGKLAILYNEKQFKQDNFVLQDVRTHHQEQKASLDNILAYVPAPKTEEDWKQKGGPALIEVAKPDETSHLLKDKSGLYRASSVWKFDNLKQGEERFMFMSLKTTPDMLQDTNAVVSISAVFIPDNPFAEHEIYDLQLQIVASHDPNKMMLKNRRMNYRFTGKKRELSYKVRFQNTGEGPAKKVAIGVRTAGALDLSTLKITGSQPRCIPCDSAYERQSCLDTVITRDSIQFIFKNIYLPGVKQKGVNDLDSTMGYVEYKVRFAKKPKKVPFDSQAAIVFDKNAPIYTNRSTGRFKPGLSPGIIAVYGSQLNHSPVPEIGKNNFSFGLSLAPYSPHRKFLQWELYVSTFNESETLLGRREGGDTVINRIGYKINYREVYSRSKVISIDAVPAQLRYNLNSFIGFGAGALVSVNLKTFEQKTRNTYLFDATGTSNTVLTDQSALKTDRFTHWKTALFADVQLGKVRVGPSVGLRYLHSLNQSDKRLSLYLTWKI